VVPSRLFHDTTSSVLVVQFLVWAFMSVSFFGFAGVARAMNTSAMLVASAARNATVEPSRERLKLEPTHASAGARRVIALLSGSSLNRYENVFCPAAKYKPFASGPRWTGLRRTPT
jgi:hypothetical protein